MALFLLLILVILTFAYLFYGRIVFNHFRSSLESTPAIDLRDGVDYDPTPPIILFGHHFSSIAGAGPIVGPIIAGLAFGWLPALLWIILGSIFIGGVHDLSALLASIDNQGKSIAQIARKNLSQVANILLSGFIWLSLIYVIVVFADLTAATFVHNGGIATSSIIYIFLALFFGFFRRRYASKTILLTIIFVPLVIGTILIGQQIPLKLSNFSSFSASQIWVILIMVYAYIASVLPVSLLLQPRDYLSSYLLFFSVIISLIGILFGNNPWNYPAFIGWNNQQLGGLFPMLFITIACGACSGFHSLVSSGTTAKQLSREEDARPIGYGGMLMETVVAVIALTTVIMLSRTDPLTLAEPMTVYASGLARFAQTLGFSAELGFAFGLLSISTFILTTLDTATRLARFTFSELFQISSRHSRFLITAFTVAIPITFNFIKFYDLKGNPIPAWKAIWPVFGASNQLLAALTLLVIAVWLRRKRKNLWAIVIPMIVMLMMSGWALALLIKVFRFSAVGVIAGLLLILAVMLLREVIRFFLKKNVN